VTSPQSLSFVSVLLGAGAELSDGVSETSFGVGVEESTGTLAHEVRNNIVAASSNVILFTGSPFSHILQHGACSSTSIEDPPSTLPGGIGSALGFICESYRMRLHDHA
jgi:hypothetical protein